MASNTNVKFYKKAYTQEQIETLCSTDGNVVFDINTQRIYVGIKDGEPVKFGGRLDLSDGAWQLTGKQFSPYKYVRCYFKQADVGQTSNYATPSLVVTIPLDEASKSSQYNAYVGSATGSNMNDKNVFFVCTCAIDSTKTKFQVVEQKSIYGTITGDRNTDGRYCYKIEGCYI